MEVLRGKYIDLMLFKCWTRVANGGPAFRECAVLVVFAWNVCPRSTVVDDCPLAAEEPTQ